MKRFWTQSEIDVLTRLYADTPTKDIAEQIGRKIGQVYQKAAALGLKKSDEYMASPHASRLRRGDDVGKEYRFKKGFTPWNKGKPGSTGTHPNSRKTQFKKGQLQGRAAEIAQPIGTERFSKEGYLERKVNNDLPMQQRWRAVHMLIWEEANGPIPEGHCLVFKDGNKQNIKLENLECITRAENMRRNSVHRYPKEIARAIQLRGALNRRINHVQKHQ